MTHRYDRTLTAAAIARVEGEGALHMRVVAGEVREVRLDIYEPPRFFEAFLRGRSYTEPRLGQGLSPAVHSAIDELAAAVLADLSHRRPDDALGQARGPGRADLKTLPLPSASVLAWH
jgi:hypothetical protein